MNLGLSSLRYHPTYASLRLTVLDSRNVPATTHFAAIGDYGYAGQAAADVASLVNSWNPEFVITLGDNNYDSGAAGTIDANIGQYYHNYIGNYTGSYGAGSPTNLFYPALGNHDWYSTTGSPALPTPYLNYFTLPGNERYYTFTQGPVQFFVIDSAQGDAAATPTEPDGISSSSVQGLWLQSQLAASTAAWKIVYFHHAPYSSATHGSNATMQWPFQAWGATAVLAGHDHSYERIDVGGLPYFVNGLGGRSLYPFGTPVAGSQLRYNADYGAMLIDASDTNLQFQFFTRNGVLIDSYAIDKSASIPVVSVVPGDTTFAEPADSGTFVLTRTGSTANSLTVNYSLNGTANSGLDFTAATGSVTFPSGSATVSVTLAPIDDALVEGNESVVLSVAANPAYNLAAASSATLTLTDNEVADTILLPANAIWKYRDDGSNQGTAWIQPNFNDTPWASSAAELGYGDGDEATTIGYGVDPNNKFITSYFRRTFTINDIAAIHSLTMRLLRDDGAVVYLNGAEVYRSNMPTGTVTYLTLASAAISGADESTFNSVPLSPSLLVNGTNVIAVELHQAAANSSDVSFNLELRGNVILNPPPPPTVIGVVFGDGTNQRSTVRQIVVTFSEAVAFMPSVASAFTLHRSGTGGTAGDVVLAANPPTGPTNSVTITFSGSLTESGNSLVDGLFDFIIDAAQVTGLGGALDGNSDTNPGGSYAVTATTANRYYRLFGDDNGDGTVSQVDYNAFLIAYLNGASLKFDFDSDGQVTQLDYNAFILRYLGSP